MMSIVLILVLLAAIAGSGMIMWFMASFSTRIKQLEQGGGVDGERLAEQIEALRQDVLATRDEVSELYERMEFTERMLTRGKGDDAK